MQRLRRATTFIFLFVRALAFASLKVFLSPSFLSLVYPSNAPNNNLSYFLNAKLPVLKRGAFVHVAGRQYEYDQYRNFYAAVL
jgi:hypothetical protein